MLNGAALLEGSGMTNESRYRTKTIPSSGAILRDEDMPEKQTSFEL
jgi:hypothetical protein